MKQTPIIFFSITLGCVLLFGGCAMNQPEAQSGCNINGTVAPQWVCKESRNDIVLSRANVPYLGSVTTYDKKEAWELARKRLKLKVGDKVAAHYKTLQKRNEALYHAPQPSLNDERLNEIFEQIVASPYQTNVWNDKTKNTYILQIGIKKEIIEEAVENTFAKAVVASREQIEAPQVEVVSDVFVGRRPMRSN